MDGVVYREGVRAWAGYPLTRDALEVYIVRDDLTVGTTELLDEKSIWHLWPEGQTAPVPATVCVTGVMIHKARATRCDVSELVREMAPVGWGDLAVEAYEQATQERC